MVAIEPDEFLGIEHLHLDQSAIDRRECQSLEAKHFLFGAGDLALYTSTRFSIRIPNSPVL